MTEGGTLSLTWSGALQGDADALDRSFWRVEIARASTVPAGQQAAWTTIENVLQTTPGSNVHSAKLGAPDAGTWAWRVCAWGVVDDVVDNLLEQLSGGCSASRTFITQPATVSATNDQKVSIGRTVTQTLPSTFVTQTTDDGTQTPVVPEPVEPPVEDPVVETVPDAIEEELAAFGDVLAGGIGDESVLGVDDGLGEGAESERDGISGALSDALGASLPLVPIPIWSLVLLGLCAPILYRWRRNVLAMFDWSDGSVDGMGTPPSDETPADLAELQHDQEVKNGSMIADTTTSPGGDAPSHDRTAA